MDADTVLKVACYIGNIAKLVYFVVSVVVHILRGGIAAAREQIFFLHLFICAYTVAKVFLLSCLSVEKCTELCVFIVCHAVYIRL